MHISRVRIGATLASLLVSEATCACTSMDNITLSRNVDVVIIGGRASDMLPSGRVTKTRVWPWSSKRAYFHTAVYNDPDMGKSINVGV
ncbi:putative FAD dependent oxidoreductase [Seiridium cardinale]